MGKNRREARLAKRSAGTGRGRPWAKRLQEAVFTLHVCSIPARLNCSIYMDYTPWLWSNFKNNLSTVKVDNLPFQSLLASEKLQSTKAGAIVDSPIDRLLVRLMKTPMASLWIPSFQTNPTDSVQMRYCKIPCIHLGRLTWNPRIHPCKRKIIFQTIIFRFYVNLLGGTPQPRASS